MYKEEIIKKFTNMPWEIWLHRRFFPFVTYMMMKAATPAEFKTQGIDGQFPIALYDTDDWYETDEMFRLGAEEAEKYLKQKDIFTLTKQCEEILEKSRKEVLTLLESDKDPKFLFEKFLDILKPMGVYLWVAHGSEPYYYKLIREAARTYVPAKELEIFIGDVSFPSKKNALALMEEDIRNGLSVDELHKKYAWIKARGGFHPGYTKQEMQKIQEKVLSEEEKTRPSVEIPNDLKDLVKEVQELVYLRTLRTDALYEIYYLATPILDKFAKSLGIDSVKYYIPDELIEGNFEKVPHEYAMIKCNDDVIVLRHSIISKKIVKANEVRGVIAQEGLIKGEVRVLDAASDVEKVKEGDVIVASMTNPSYVSAMHRAAAFVTDEGGLTCHAAIIAREMKKPCVIGTKIATKIFKDGDIVEVDAEKGIVKKL